MLPFEFRMRQFFVFIISSVCFLGCADTEHQETAEAPSQPQSFTYGRTLENVVDLSPDTAEQVAQWEVLKDLIHDVKRTEDLPYMKLREHVETIRQFTDSAANSVPDAFRTNAITSRMLVLKTRAALLYQSSHQSYIDTLQINKDIREMRKAVNDLVVQMNEKTEKDKIDMQRQHSERTERNKNTTFRDSIMQLERNDQNRNNPK